MRTVFRGRVVKDYVPILQTPSDASGLRLELWLEDFGFGVSQIPVPKFGFKEGKRFKGSGILGWFVDEGTLRA